mmetsp:Transcript_39456/g.91552  ORF Transcript_39456/g.91552 Transcript_39456/m.91552 type:complete len:250 (-) Transcript_39456:350-1099(-)
MLGEVGELYMRATLQGMQLLRQLALVLPLLLETLLVQLQRLDQHRDTLLQGPHPQLLLALEQLRLAVLCGKLRTLLSSHPLELADLPFFPFAGLLQRFHLLALLAQRRLALIKLSLLCGPGLLHLHLCNVPRLLRRLKFLLARCQLLPQLSQVADCHSQALSHCSALVPRELQCLAEAPCFALALLDLRFGNIQALAPQCEGDAEVVHALAQLLLAALLCGELKTIFMLRLLQEGVRLLLLDFGIVLRF